MIRFVPKANRKVPRSARQEGGDGAAQALGLFGRLPSFLGKAAEPILWRNRFVADGNPPYNQGDGRLQSAVVQLERVGAFAEADGNSDDPLVTVEETAQPGLH